MAESFAPEKVIVEAVDKFIVQPIKHQCDYLCFFSRNVDHLNHQHQNLRDAIHGLTPRITAAENNVQEILPAVSRWLERANEKLSQREEIMSRIENTNTCCSSVKSRYSLSRRAVKTAEAMKRLREECPKSEEPITLSPAALAAVPDKLERSTVDFDSRKEIEDKVMRLLRNEEVKIIGIHGMGGVGKTILADKIKNRVLSDGENRFDASLMVVVSQDPDMLRIQKEIAEKLGMKFEETSLSSRAQRLRERLMGGKRILIILDDVWKYLDLYKLGIPCSNGSGRCTVLLTSRNRDVLDGMGAHKPIPEMKILTEEESLSFFIQKMGGTRADDPTWLSSKVKEIVKECKCLPLALEIVARAMKAKRDHEASWDAALVQLRSANPADVGDVLENVYKPLRLSYDFLSENARFIFLLCCQFAEDSDISLERLTFYAMGLGMWLQEFKEMDHLAQVRNRTHALIETIKSCSLLLESKKEECVRMHDIVRDVGIYIAASKEKQLIKCSPDCEWISPFCGGRNTIDLSGGSTFPKLCLLIIDDSGVIQDKKLQLQIDNDFFKGMIKLNVLCVRYNYSFESLPHSMRLLKDLRTLIIEGCAELIGIGIVGELVNLEILMLRRCSGIEELCWDTQGPKCLRLLEISDCYNLRRIGGGVISSVNKLEELMIVENDKLEWEEEGLREVESLENLRRLEIQVSNYKLAALQITLPNISKFRIIFGHSMITPHFNDELAEFGKTMSLNCESEISLGTWIKESLLRNVECLYLKGIHLPNALDLSRALNTKSLIIKDCWMEGREHLWSSNVVSHNIHLSTIRVEMCKNLHSLSPISRGSDYFPQLIKELQIKDCEMLEHVFQEDENEKIITGQQSTESVYRFQLLNHIYIKNCQQLKAFISSFQGSGDVDHHSSHFFCKVSFGNLRSITMDDINVESLFCPQIPIESFTKLEVLKIRSMNKVESLFSVVIAQNLVNLQRITIDNCDVMVQVIGGDDDKKDVNIITFPNLKKLELKSLLRLTSLYEGMGSIKFPVLEDITINKCSGLKRVISVDQGIKLDGDDPHHYSPLFCHHQVSFTNSWRRLDVEGNASINNLFCPQIDLIHFFTNLELLQITSFHKMKSLFSALIARNLVNLQEVSIGCCEEMIQVIDGNEDEIDNIIGQDAASTVFPKLEKLKLWDLPKLTSVYKGIGNIEFRMLELTVNIRNCLQLNRAVPDTEDIKVGHHHFSSHLFCHPQIQFRNLKKLTISTSSQIAFGPQLPTEFLTRLEELVITECDGMSSLFSCSTAANLINLRRLQISNCGKMVEVIEEEKEYSSHHNQTTLHLFPNLNVLDIWNLPELKIFSRCRRCALNNMASLERVIIEDCPKMERLISLGSLSIRNLESAEIDYKLRGDLQRLNDEVSFNKLKTLHPDNVGFKEIPILDFSTRSLEILSIGKCEGMSSLFSCSTAANLINLRRLQIWNCGKMVEVIEEEKEYSSHHNQTTLLFPNLKKLTLCYLRELKIFSGCRRCALNMPSLEHVYISDCPKMERFSLGSLTTPNLKTVKIQRESISMTGEKGLNDAVHQYFFTNNSSVIEVDEDKDAKIVEQQGSTSNEKNVDKEEERDADEDTTHDD